jgi:hypothetical protein
VQTIRDAIKTGDEITVRILNYKRSGTPFWNMFTLAPMKDSDDTIRFLVGVQVGNDSVTLIDRWYTSVPEVPGMWFVCGAATARKIVCCICSLTDIRVLAQHSV